MASEAREKVIRELTELGWGKGEGGGQIAAGARQLLRHLRDALGPEAGGMLIDLALHYLLNEQFGCGQTPPGEQIDPRLEAAAALFRPDEEAIVRECTARLDDKVLRGLLVEVRAEYA